jgi:hypothetical protein
VLVRCTTKLLKAIGTEPTLLADTPPSDHDWYANLLWITGRKSVLLTHAGTLFSVFVPDVSVLDLRPFGQFVVPAIHAAVRSEELPVATFGPLDAEGVAVAKTANRSVLGCMNDLAMHCNYATEDAGGLELLNVEQLNRRLRRTILGPLGSTYPIEAARDYRRPMTNSHHRPKETGDP